MKIGMIGLGKMGGNMAERLRRHGHTVVGYDHVPDHRQVGSLSELVEALDPPRVVWSMVPAGDPTEYSVMTMLDLLAPGDLIVEGGNSNFHDSQRRAATAARVSAIASCVECRAVSRRARARSGAESIKASAVSI